MNNHPKSPSLYKMYYDNFMSDILFFFGWWVQDQGLHIFEKGRRT